MSKKYSNLTSLLANIVDNRGKSVPVSDTGFPLIATNCIKHTSIYPTFENIRYVNDDIKNNWFRAHPEPNDIIFVNKGTPGRVCLVPDPVSFCFAQDMIGFRCDPEKIDYQYLFAILRSEYIQKKIENYHVGLVIPHFKKGDLDSLTIPRMASRAEELAIGELYLTLSKKIELNNRINAELEAMAKTLYDYWFVQFDFPNEEGKPYKSSGGKMVYNTTLEHEIPEEWGIGTISEFISSFKGGDWGKETIEGKYTIPVTCIRGADINGLNGAGQIGAPKRYILDRNKEKFLLPYDLVIEISGGSPTQSTGRLVLITDRMLSRFDEPLICSNFCKAISLIDRQYAYNFMYMWNSIYDNGVLFGWEGKTSGIKNLLFESFVSKHKICMPTKELVNKFFNFAENIHKKKQDYLKENEKLTQLRDWLLPMLMNGQVTVK